MATTPTNFPNGVTNADPNLIFGSLTTVDPQQLHTYWNDFDTYTAGDWVVTVVGSGTAALTAGDGGLLLVTNSAADNDAVTLQKTPAAFAMTAGKAAWFACRFNVSDATQSDVQVGLVIVDTTPLDATDGIFFQKDDGDTHIDFYVQKNTTTGSTSVTDIAELADATNVTLAWYYDGNSSVYYGVNGTILGKLDGSSSFLPDATNLTVSLTIQNGEAVAKTLTVDYVMMAKQR